MKVLCLGSICLDILVKNINELPKPNHVMQIDDIKLMGGGGALNTSIVLKRFGVESYLMGEVGQDYAGRILLNIMEEESVNSNYVLQKESKRSSVVNVLINKDGERSFLCNPGNFIQIALDEYDWNLLKNFNVLLIASCLLFDNLLPDFPKILNICRQYNVISIVDTVWPTKPTHKLIINSLPYIDYFTPSLEEAQVISGQQTPKDISQWCLDHGTKNVIIKMDKEGCYLANKDLQLQIPALKIPLVDSTGAGDCFLAGLIKGLLEKYPLINATQLANSAGAMCVQSLGAYTGITNFEDLLKNFYSRYNK